MTIAQRVRRSVGHRPWNLDLFCGAVLASVGRFIFTHPAPIQDRETWAFLRDIDLRCLGVALIALGVSQVAAALLNVFWARWALAFFAAANWAAFRLGIYHFDPESMVIVFADWLALANVLILVRLY